jgi:MoaA/NifB/PqqE/SkfB family radical SAM enzyme
VPRTLPLQLDSAAPARIPNADTILAHWGPAQRAIHRLCRRSRAVNTAVAALEMRLGREELLSLPQYMALCPTGQCNALCGFCSVTTSRSGIIKKQLPFDAIARFTGPVSRVIRMYGLEGNGEPTLYERFDDLAAELLRNGATAYLITNGDRLTPASVDALVARGLDAVNFSLNAATAETHRRIMKLKDFDRVLGNIRRFVSARGAKPRPIVSVSMVVTRDNVHEVVDFIRLAEQDLGVDRVLVRPLSEIATEHGAVEDLRPLVPFESEITAMLAGVRDYLASTPRKAAIEIVPENFRAVRPDPPSDPDAPFAVPHRGRWEITSAGVRVEWNGTAVRLEGVTTRGPYLLKSYSIACAPQSRVELPMTVRVDRGALGIGVLSANQDLWLTTKALSSGNWTGTLPFDTAGNERVYVVLYGERDGDLAVTVDWTTAIDPTPARLEPQQIHTVMAPDPTPAAAQAAPAAPATPRWSDRMRKIVHGDVKYYCQKPWTDLHNFTVDGRMDVCCIATGESQKRYALGNLLTQSFQDVWNGPVAREFRRTVNSATPLPPCRRCPMAFAYQGPLFNPAGPQRRAGELIDAVCKHLPFGRRIAPGVTAVSSAIISHALFRGFKR